VISRSEMIQKVWGQGADLDLRSVDAHVYRLRRKILHPRRPRHRLPLRAARSQRAPGQGPGGHPRGQRPPAGRGPELIAVPAALAGPGAGRGGCTRRVPGQWASEEVPRGRQRRRAPLPPPSPHLRQGQPRPLW
jgi:hypothetical protein